MEKIPSALDFLIIKESEFNEHVSGEAFPILEKLLKEFAKLHVKAALESAKEETDLTLYSEIDVKYSGIIEKVKEEILNSYPENLIK